MVKGEIMAEINAAQLAKQCSKCKMVGYYTAMCKTKTRGGAANSLGGRKRGAEVNKYLEEVVVDDR